MRVHSYVVLHDVGFAPNPYFGVCSLATCKVNIRATAQLGDWIVGTGSEQKGLGGKLVFAMKIDEIVTFDEYWNDERFRSKRPRMGGGLKVAHGDNIYHRDHAGDWIQEDSRHSFNSGAPNPGHIAADTGVDRILLGRRFVYFGGEGPPVPPSLTSGFERSLVHRRQGHRNRFPVEQVEAAVEWLEGFETGIYGRPVDWPARANANQLAS